MNVTGFMFALLITSTFTGLTTEAVKSILDEHGWAYASNTLAGIVAAVVGLIVGIVYLIADGASFGLYAVVSVVVLMLLSWLCAMVGYDKVVQTIAQLGGDE